MTSHPASLVGDRPDVGLHLSLGPQVEAPISHPIRPPGRRVSGQAAAIVPYGRWSRPIRAPRSSRRCSGSQEPRL
ncbi:protein of unknown function [Streptomyces murinus]